jgi:hypothetical protein
LGVNKKRDVFILPYANRCTKYASIQIRKRRKYLVTHVYLQRSVTVYIMWSLYGDKSVYVGSAAEEMGDRKEERGASRDLSG